RPFYTIDYFFLTASSSPSTSTISLLDALPIFSQAPPSGRYPQILSFDGDPGIYVQAGTGRPYLQIHFPTAGWKAVVASTPVSSALYTHVAGTWNWDGTNTVMRIYVNGALDATRLAISDRLV